MKNTFPKTLLLLLVILATAVASFGAGKNLVSGVGPIVSSHNNGDWAGFSSLSLIPGTAIMPITTTSTAFYITFVGGTEADISNMVLYKTTARGSFTIASATPVKLGGVSNPTIMLSNKTTCKTQPVSAAHPCTIRLDLLSLQPSPLADYWLVIYFTNNTNNQTVYAGTSFFQGGSLTAGYELADDTHLTAGQSVPSLNKGYPYFLTKVATN